MRRSVLGLGIFLAFALLFIALRTQQYIAVDGALRALSVYWLGYPPIGDNNHLLYFVNVFAWTKAASQLGIRSTSPFDFIRAAQAMNAVAAAGAAVMLWSLADAVNRNLTIASAATCTFAFSSAFLLHATNSAEPMVGLLWSLFSVVAVGGGVRAKSRALIALGGALLLLAMATYESMALLGPAELLFIYLSSDRSKCFWFLLGCGLGVALAYVPAYYATGTSTPISMADRFLAIGGGTRAYGRVTMAKILNAPVGLTNNIVAVVPADYAGLRSLLRERASAIGFVAAGLVITYGWLLTVIWRLLQVWPDLANSERTILECCAVALVVSLLPVFYWDPLYDKLWLLPLAIIFFSWSIVAAAWSKDKPWRLIPEVVLIVIIVTLNVTRAVQATKLPPACMVAAGTASQTIGPDDVLISGWDPVSILYESFWGGEAQHFDVPAVATTHGAGTMELLNSKLEASRGPVYLLGIVDLPENSWNSYLGARCGLPFSSFDKIRGCSKPLETLTCADGTSEVLWRMPLDCYFKKND